MIILGIIIITFTAFLFINYAIKIPGFKDVKPWKK